MASVVATTPCEDRTLTSLFQEASLKIDEVKNRSKSEIKSIICALAKNLEGKIELDNICQIIKHRLSGKVSSRFVDMCLDVKYKKGYRMQNAKKRVKQSDLAEGLLLKPYSQCSRCKDLYLKIEELENALTEASQPRNLEVIEIEFPIELSIIQNCITNASQHWRSLPQMWFNVKVEKTSGKVISATTGRIHELILPNNQQTGRV